MLIYHYIPIFSPGCPWYNFLSFCHPSKHNAVHNIRNVLYCGATHVAYTLSHYRSICLFVALYCTAPLFYPIQNRPPQFPSRIFHVPRRCLRALPACPTCCHSSLQNLHSSPSDHVPYSTWTKSYLSKSAINSQPHCELPSCKPSIFSTFSCHQSDTVVCVTHFFIFLSQNSCHSTWRTMPLNRVWNYSILYILEQFYDLTLEHHAIRNILFTSSAFQFPLHQIFFVNGFQIVRHSSLPLFFTWTNKS